MLEALGPKPDDQTMEEWLAEANLKQGLITQAEFDKLSAAEMCASALNTELGSWQD